VGIVKCPSNQSIGFRPNAMGGAGAPTAWQGWIVIGIFACLILAGAVVLLPSRGAALFVAYAVLLCVVLIVVCWFKGEPPRWRWGDE
jgi:hypothetical protein